MLSKGIIFKSDLSLPETINQIENGMSVGFELFPGKIMTGNIYGTKISATINPPQFMSDPSPFRRHVRTHSR